MAHTRHGLARALTVLGTKPMTNKTTFLMTSLLISTAFIVGVVPTSMAHTCTAQDPAKSCGDCNSGIHDHEYNNGTNYCRSSAGDPGTRPNPCDYIGSIVTVRGPVIFDTNTGILDTKTPGTIGRLYTIDCDGLPAVKAFNLALEVKAVNLA